MEQVSFPYRVFQVWSYTVGMSRLLLRSTKTPTFATRVDVLFQNVQAMKLTTRLEGLSLRLPTKEEQVIVEADTGLTAGDDARIFMLEGDGRCGYVVAGVVVSHEDEGEYDDESALLGFV